MALEPFNSLGGYTVGIPAVSVVDANGNVTTNLNAPTANVTANTVYANYYKYANGVIITTTAAGTNTQVQYNNAGNFGASAEFVFNSASNLLTVQNIAISNISNLGNVENVRILGGINGYFLQTDGTGNLTWTAGGGGGGNGNPGGANTQVQFNDAGVFNGDAGFTYNKNTNTLHVDNLEAGEAGFGNITITSNIISTGNIEAAYFLGDGSQLTNVSATTSATANTVTNNSQPNITNVGTLSSLDLSGNITNANWVFSNYFAGNGNSLFGIVGSNIVGTVANANFAAYSGNVTVAAQPNITSLGNLTGLTVTGNINAGNTSLSGELAATTITVSGNANINVGATLRSFGDVNFTQSPNVSLGNISNLHISGGTNGYVLATNGAGGLYWTAGGGGGNGTPGGSNTQVQYNDSGSFAGSAFLTFNNYTNTLNVAGNLIANAVTVGSGVYRFCTSNVYAATTASDTADQVIFSVDANSISAIDFAIISTDLLGSKRQISKITAVVYETTVNYNEYSSLSVNGLTGDFKVAYDAGNIILAPKINLVVTPTSANSTKHKMMITLYEL